MGTTLGPMGAAPPMALGWQPVLTPAEAARYQGALDAALAATETRGATLAVARRGELLWSGASGAWTDGSPIRVDQPIVIGSITKTFVAALVLQLVEEGRVRLDDTLAGSLPGVEIPAADRISLRQLLDHTSGLADLFNETTRVGIEDAPDRPWSADEILATLHEPWYEPGEKWAYASTNYLLLTMIVERLTALTLEDAIAERFTEPLGMAESRLLSPAGEPGSPLGAAWTTIFRGSGAMVSTAAELAHWGDALYAGDVLLEETRSEMLAFNDFDHGLGVRRLEVGSVEGFGHTGLLDTYTCLLFHAPVRGVTIALLVDEDHAELGPILTHREDDGPSLLDLALKPLSGD